jgi:hypothetical protein
MIRRIAVVLSMLMTSLAAAAHAQSNYEHLREYGEAVIGRWVGTATLAAAVAGLGEAGDRITGQAVSTWILDKNAIECNWSFGTAAGKWIAVWDAAEKTVKRFAVSSTGEVLVSSVSKEGDKWVERLKGTTEGKPSSRANTWRFADGGRTVVIEETEQVVGGEKRADLRHEWKRVDR